MLLSLVVLASLAVLATAQDTTLWYNRQESLPIGNGRLGAQVMGGSPTETLVLNEDHIWSGSLNNPNNGKCPGVLGQIRDAIWRDDLLSAHNLFQNNCMANPIAQQMYQTAGNLSIIFPGELQSTGNFNHSLDLATAIATTTYTTSNGNRVTRTSFASNPDNVIVMRVQVANSGSLKFEAKFNSPMSNVKYSSSGNAVTVTGSGTGENGLGSSINFLARAEITSTGGSVTTGSNSVIVSGANEAIIKIAIDTNYIKYNNLSANPESKVSATLSAVRSKTYDQLRSAHVSDHSALFGRVSISLGRPNSNTNLPTNQRKGLPGGDSDASFFALYAQYGRYLGIASSRKTEPSNLQGVWNRDPHPPWGSKYTVNINQQMNSWLAEPLNLPETLDPLWNMLSEVAERGKAAAATQYGINRGWVGHHNTGIWRDSAPIDGAQWGVFPTAFAWMLQHMWEHYNFAPDNVDWVRNVAYPLMKGLSEFYLDFLVQAPQNVESAQYLVTNPSTSPEKVVRTTNGVSISVTYGSTIDNTLLLDLFSNTAQFANLLGVDGSFASNLTATAKRLIPFRIGSNGALQEWAKDYPNGAFTHISHLYPLFPSNRIDPRLNTTLSNAARNALTNRGDADAGWPTAWRANCYARLFDGEKAYYLLKRLSQLFTYDNLWSINGNVWQIDGNFGGANAVAEMILQSHNGEIYLLPAIPNAWSEGKVTGFRARGGFTLDIAWSNKALTQAVIKSTSGTSAKVRYNGKTTNLTFTKGESKTVTPSSF